MSTLPPEYKYQAFARERIVNLKRTAVIAIPGCGKTRPIIDALVELQLINPGLVTPEGMRFPEGSIFIVCSGPAIATWLKQIPEWTDDFSLKHDIYVVRGPKHKRMALWYQAQVHPGIYITNFSVFYRDHLVIREVKWSAVIADEYHKSMRRHKSETFKRFRSMTRHIKVLVLASGSLVSRNPASMWTAFALIKPSLFRGFWKFAKTYCNIDDGEYGKTIWGVKNVEALKKIMDRYLAYIPEEVVADQLPEGKRQTVAALMTPKQAKVYNDIAEDMIHVIEESDKIIVAPNILSQLIKLRQLLCCPRILDPTFDMGGGFEILLTALEETPHMAIFVPFRPAVTYITDELRRKGYDVNYLRGGVTTEEQMERTEYFRKHKSIIVCTIAYAESFDLETCNTSYFLGYDYSVDTNKQAEGRTRRAISGHKFVTWNYIKYMHTIDEELLLKLDEDIIIVRKILSRPQAIIDALKGIQHDK